MAEEGATGGAPTRAPGPPRTESDLLARAGALAGLTLGEVADRLGHRLPPSTVRGKGWSGALLEAALGATAGSLPEPDFQLIGVELKSVPVRADGWPRESTYVGTVPLGGDAEPCWERSNVCRKLARVLWVPILTPRGTPLARRRIGTALLWSPSGDEAAALRADWEELMEMVVLGRVEHVTARDGTVLQIRPKAADSRARRRGVGESGASVDMLPRGFYLRAGFTGAILRRNFVMPG